VLIFNIVLYWCIIHALCIVIYKLNVEYFFDVMKYHFEIVYRESLEIVFFIQNKELKVFFFFFATHLFFTVLFS
jgi:hypothetical protein